MYYYRSLSYGRTEKNEVYLSGTDHGLKNDPYLQQRLNRPITSKDTEKVMFAHPVRCSACWSLFSILSYFAKKLCAKASLLIDYDHYECILQISRLCDPKFQGIEKDLLLYVLVHTQNIRTDPMENGQFALTMEYPLFEPLASQDGE